MTDDDAKKLAEISKDLPPADLDVEAARRIMEAARRDVGRGASRIWMAEAALVAIFTSGILVWTLLKVIEIFK